LVCPSKPAEFVQCKQQQGRLCPDLTADKTECHKAADCFESVPIPRLCGQRMPDISHSRKINAMTTNDVSVYCIAYFSWKLKKWRLDIVARGTLNYQLRDEMLQRTVLTWHSFRFVTLHLLLLHIYTRSL
jgi:hypothetical protein